MPSPWERVSLAMPTVRSPFMGESRHKAPPTIRSVAQSSLAAEFVKGIRSRGSLSRFGPGGAVVRPAHLNSRRRIGRHADSPGNATRLGPTRARIFNKGCSVRLSLGANSGFRGFITGTLGERPRPQITSMLSSMTTAQSGILLNSSGRVVGNSLPTKTQIILPPLIR